MKAKESELADIENELKEMHFQEKQDLSDFDKNMKEEILNVAKVFSELQTVGDEIIEVKKGIAEVNDSINKIDQEMDELNSERLRLERESYAAKAKLILRPAKIEKINLALFQTKKVDFNESIQVISPSSSSDLSSSKSVTEFVPYIERPAQKPMNFIKGVKPIKFVPQLIPISSQPRSNLEVTQKPKYKIEISERVKEVKKIGMKKDISPTISSEIPSKLKKLEPKKIIPKQNQKINILEDVVIKPADKKNDVIVASSSTSYNEFIQPVTKNVRIVSKRKDCSPISMEELQKLSPVLIQKIKHVKIMPNVSGISPEKENNKSPDSNPTVANSDEMSVDADSIENLLKEDVDFGSIDDININDENWEMNSNFSCKFFFFFLLNYFV